MKTYAFPGIIEDDILDIASRQIPYMRTAWFSSLMKENERMLLDAIGCRKGRVMFFTSSGTAAMESVVQNYVAALGKAFIIDGGTFGHRWVEICNYHGVENESMRIPFAEDIDYNMLEERVRSYKPKVFLCQHHETSSGQLFDLKRISDICRNTGTSLVTDVISSFLAEDLDMDQLGIDVAVTSSQKGLNLPPGASLVFLSEKALQVDFRHNNFYLDFQDNLKNLERGQTPFSPATTIFMQIHERMRRNMEKGIAGIIAETRAKALYFRELCARHDWEIPASNPSNAVTGFFVHRNAGVLCDELQKRDIFIMPSGKPHFFRVSHMGSDSMADLDELAAIICEIENLP
ncbi:MAG: alanine--glyoxylate aminotransferase family protein [Bacteroidaceae bacterium]|nr:alanine--glyoxylate aminotransferase family protein [Bacteroidaceae bacterium]